MFLSNNEKKISEMYLKKGFVLHNINNLEDLHWIRNAYLEIIQKNIPKIKKKNNSNVFDNIHKYIKSSKLNTFRLDVINQIHKKKDFREKFYKISKELVDIIVGNEVAMQLRIGLSIQLPGDESSLLPIHADTWTGVSPYESVVWLPLVDCYKTKSMFILPADKINKIGNIFNEKKIIKSNDIFKRIERDLIWLKVKYGQAVIFDHSLPHGNIVNREKETRWSMNCRFKSIFTPYKDKKLGEYYEPITLRPASKRGMEYKFPK